ncbi:type VI secretion system lipoprotein TssJ [Azotobacter armeniacus]
MATPYQVKLVAEKNINPDIRRRPSPIVVKVFELRTGAAFETSDFFSLQDKPETALGQELIAVEQVILHPGEVKYVTRHGNLDARVIGIMAEYRVLEASRWRQLITLPQPKQLSPYRFWKTSPEQLRLGVVVKSDGIDFLPVSK